MNKILLLCPTPPPYAGPEVASEILIEHLKGLPIEFEHMKANLRTENWQKGKFDIIGILAFTRVIKEFIKRLYNKDIKKIYLLLSSSKVGFVRDSIYILLSVLLSKKIIVHYRGGNFHGFYGKSPYILRKFITFILNRTDLIIVQANVLKKMFDGITKTGTAVLYNGLEKEDDSVKKEFNKEKTVLLFMGHIAFSKGFYELINVYKQIYKEYNLSLRFAGTFRFEGKKSKTQKAFLNGETLKLYNANSEKISLEIKEFVENAESYNAKYLGIISGDYKESVFKNSDILLLPSYTEGFSVTVLEAISKGLPVIVSNVGALPEIIKEDVNGWVCEPGDENSLKEKILKALKQKTNFEKISAENTRYFKENFLVEKIASQFVNILTNV